MRLRTSTDRVQVASGASRREASSITMGSPPAKARALTPSSIGSRSERICSLVKPRAGGRATSSCRSRSWSKKTHFSACTNIETRRIKRCRVCSSSAAEGKPPSPRPGPPLCPPPCPPCPAPISLSCDGGVAEARGRRAETVAGLEQLSPEISSGAGEAGETAIGWLIRHTNYQVIENKARLSAGLALDVGRRFAVAFFGVFDAARRLVFRRLIFGTHARRFGFGGRAGQIL